MRNYSVTQTGDNPGYPKKAEVWKFGDPVPEWLSDRAQVKELSEKGEPVLETRRCTTGEIEIIEAGGRGVLVRVKNKDSIVLFSETHPLISLTPHQLELLYE